MRTLILVILLLCTSLVYTQPKLVGSVTASGPAEGGSLFRLDMPGTSPGVIHSFNNLAPHRPAGGVCAGDGDWLYGMLTFNGVNNQGCLYRVRRDGTDFTVVYQTNNFVGSLMVPYYHSDGNIYFSNEFQLKKLDPVTMSVTDINLFGGAYTRNLLIDASDWIYMMTNGSTLSRIKTDGTQWTNLHAFDPATEGTGGITGLTETGGDTLFGVQNYGGMGDGGTIYSIKKDGTGLMIHHHFTDATGKYPESRLEYFDGKLYGTTTQGGNFANGVLYSINTDGSGYHVLHHFEPGAFTTGSVFGNISIAGNGRIFGSFYQFYVQGFTYSRYFKVDTSGTNFETFGNVDQRASGHFNQSMLLVNGETIYTATMEMGRHDGGVISQCDTMGNGISLHHFGYSPNGFRPAEGLIKASDGKLYGTTDIGGLAGNGVVFSMNTDGTGYVKLHEFTDDEGYDPSGKLLEGSDGKLYGACYYGGPLNTGCLYRLNKNGTNFEIIYNFPTLPSGYWPLGGLIEDASGFLYGTTFGALNGSGSIFRINKDGSNFTVLQLMTNSTMYAFFGGLSMSGNYLFGSGAYGGPFNMGGIFRINKDGTGFTELHNFTGATDGNSPRTIPFVASNGKLYGTTENGGLHDEGTIFSMNQDGSNFTVLKSLSFTDDGAYPRGLIQASDGLLYGTTFLSNAGSGTGGTVFRLNLDGSAFTLLKEFNSTTEGQGVSPIIDLNGNFVLPVEWMTFNGTERNGSALLSWKTAQEQNSDRFEVERSTDGNRFAKIGTVAAAGNTSNISSYSFTDHQPFQGVNYYRLKQVDFDSRTDYSRVVSVNIHKGKKFQIAPNPVVDQLNIRIPAGHSFTALRIIDPSGKLVLQQKLNASTTNILLDTRTLISGWYIAQLTGEEATQEVFLKQ